MEDKPRLGRGLDALLNVSTEEAQESREDQVAISVIDPNPHQPRKTFDEDELQSLGNSITSHGILQPLVVRRSGDRFQLVAGERRLKAAEMVGLDRVPVTIVDFNDQQVLEAALIENIQRSDLNPIEKAQGFQEHLKRFKMTHQELAKRLGLARSTITNFLNLLELDQEVQDLVRSGQLSTGHAKVLKGVRDKARQVELSRQIIARGLSVHATEALLKESAQEEEPTQTEPEPEKVVVEKTQHVQGIEDDLRQQFSTKLEIKVKAKEKGHIVIHFASNEEFERIVDRLRKSG